MSFGLVFTSSFVCELFPFYGFIRAVTSAKLRWVVKIGQEMFVAECRKVSARSAAAPRRQYRKHDGAMYILFGVRTASSQTSRLEIC